MDTFLQQPQTSNCSTQECFFQTWKSCEDGCENSSHRWGCPRPAPNRTHKGLTNIKPKLFALEFLHCDVTWPAEGTPLSVHRQRQTLRWEEGSPARRQPCTPSAHTPWTGSARMPRAWQRVLHLGSGSGAAALLPGASSRAASACCRLQTPPFHPANCGVWGVHLLLESTLALAAAPEVLLTILNFSSLRSVVWAPSLVTIPSPWLRVARALQRGISGWTVKSSSWRGVNHRDKLLRLDRAGSRGLCSKINWKWLSHFLRVGFQSTWSTVGFHSQPQLAPSPISVLTHTH